MNFADQLREQGFDIIVMDQPAYTRNFPATENDPSSSLPYPNPPYSDLTKGLIYGGGDYIQRNAYALEALIDHCNQEMQQNNSTEKLVIVGPSMGGQISRYALRDMEVRGQNHNCRVWVSFDSPHNGAWVPVGIQQMLKSLADASNKEKLKKFLAAWVNCSAAKQLTLHHYLSNSATLQGAPNFFNSYYDEINNPNFGFPQATGLRRLAMLSGSDLGVAMPYGQACQESNHFDVVMKSRGFWNWLVSYVVPVIPAFIGIAATQHHYSYLAPASGTCLSYKKQTVLGTVNLQYVTASSFSNTTLDMTQGGDVPVFTILHDELRLANENNLFSFWQKFLTSYAYNGVPTGNQEPTYSTIALGRGSAPDPTRKWDANFRIDKFNQPCDVTCPETKESPFDMYWAPDVNTRHDSLLLGHVVRLRKEIIDKQEWQKTQLQRQVTIQSTTTNLCNGQNGTFSLSHTLPGMTYNWTSNNPSLQVISGQGTTSAVIQNNGSSNGYYQINVQASSPCYLINGSYSIHIGGYSSSDYPISGPSSVCKNSYAYFNTVELPGATNYQWTWTSNLTYVSG